MLLWIFLSFFFCFSSQFFLETRCKKKPKPKPNKNHHPYTIFPIEND